MAAHAELAAAHSGDDLVLHDVRRAGHGCADLRIRILDLPHLAARRRVERDQIAIELAEEDLAVGVGQAPIHVVATRDGLNTGVLLRQIPPFDAPDVRDRKSTRLNSSHLVISYAVFCLKKKKKKQQKVP